MSNFSDFIGGSGGGSLPVNIVLTTSQTWVPPVDGNICIHVIGGGGAGLGSNSSATAGGAGGYCKKNSLAVTTSSSFTVVVGAGGVGTNNASTPSNAGASTVSGTGLSATLTANYGGGAYNGGSGVGGNALNGDVNNTGGNGNSNYGGGAVGFYGTGNSSTNQYSGQTDASAAGLESLAGYGHLVGGLARKWCRIPNWSHLQTYNPTSQDAGLFCGGGSVYVGGNSTSYNWVKGGQGGLGGGGGGVRNQGDSASAYGGDGGNGVVIIQYLPA